MCWGRCGASQLLPAPGAIPEPQFPLFLWDFVVTVVTRATTVWVSWSSPSAHSPSEHSKKKSLIILSPKIPAKPRLCPGWGGSQTLPGVQSPPSPSPDGVAGPCTGFVLVLYWFCPGSQYPAPGLAAAFPNPKSLFSPPCAPTLPC